MSDWVITLIVDEGKWLTCSMGLAAIGVAVLAYRYRRAALSVQQRIMAAMNLAAGITIGTMAFGHLLAVTTKLTLGTLREGSLLAFAAIGVSLLVPSVMVITHTQDLLTAEGGRHRSTAMRNAWLAATLLAMGIHNLPLAMPSLLNIAYRVNSNPIVRSAIVGMALTVHVGLFAASLVFLASGQSFEQFRGIE